MRSRARLFRHPMHPMLVMFPTALFPLLLVLDALHLFLGDEAFWRVGFWVAALGVLTTVAAIIPGTIDMAAIPDRTKAHRTGAIHAVVGTLVLLLYVGALAARWPAGSPPEGLALAMGLDVAGLLAVSAQGWLGGELVYRHHIGVLSEPEGGEPTALAGKDDAPAAVPRAGRRQPRP